MALLRQHLVAAELVDGAALGGLHQPGAGIVRNAVLRPLLQRDHQRILRQLLGETDVARHLGQAGDELGGFDAPDGFDGALGGKLRG